MSRPVLGGVVLAAGLSNRMRTLKPLLPLDGAPAVVRAARSFCDIGITPVVVVGHAADQVVEALDGVDARCVRNEAYRTGMWSSVVCGLREVVGDAEWTGILPGDCALVRPETIGSVLRRARSGGDHDVVHPMYAGRRGHPPLLHARLVCHALGAQPRGGLHEILAAHEQGAIEVAVEDPGVLQDMDRPEHYVAMERRARLERLPDDHECELLQDRFGVPAAVREHCAAVAELARALGEALNHRGGCLNQRLLRSAALLHDVARTERDHAAAGARRLVEAGYPRLAGVVATHMDLPEPVLTIPGETEVLYLADKLVLGNRVVSLERRRAQMLRRFSGDSAASRAADHRLFVAERIARAVEGYTGRALAGLVGCCEARRTEGMSTGDVPAGRSRGESGNGVTE